MSPNDSINWIDMVNPIHSLAKLVDINPEEVTVTGLAILDSFMTVYYDDSKKTPRFKTIRYC